MKSWLCDALLFDLDGVLIDSEVCVQRHWRRWCRERGVNFDQLMAVAHGRRAEDTMRQFAPHLDAEAEARRFADLEALDPSGVAAMPGARELLADLPADVWAIVTSGARITALSRIRHAGLPEPRVLITAEHVTHGKPDPQGYLLAAQALGAAPSNCVVIEDAPSGIAAARAAGIRVLGICATHASPALSAADAVIENLAGFDWHPGANGARLEITVRVPMDRSLE